MPELRTQGDPVAVNDSTVTSAAVLAGVLAWWGVL